MGSLDPRIVLTACRYGITGKTQRRRMRARPNQA
jgi:hypothetical protein